MEVSQESASLRTISFARCRVLAAPVLHCPNLTELDLSKTLMQADPLVQVLTLTAWNVLFAAVSATAAATPAAAVSSTAAVPTSDTALSSDTAPTHHCCLHLHCCLHILSFLMTAVTSGSGEMQVFTNTATYRMPRHPRFLVTTNFRASRADVARCFLLHDSRFSSWAATADNNMPDAAGAQPVLKHW